MATLGNQNAAKHGLRMALPRLPRGCDHVRRQVEVLRQTLEASLEARSVEVGPYEAACIAACCKWQRHGSLAAKWLRQRAGEMSDADRLKYSAEVAKASDAVVRHMAAMGLNKSDADNVFDALYGPQPGALSPPAGGNGETRHETAGQTAPGAPGSAAGGGDGEPVGQPADATGGGLGHEAGHDAIAQVGGEQWA